MYAIVDIAGFQFNVEPGKKLYVHRLQGEKDDKVRFDKVLLTDHDGDIKVGTPGVEGGSFRGLDNMFLFLSLLFYF